MRWQRAAAAVLALGLFGGFPAGGRAGWLTLTSGVAGAPQPSATADLWFDFPTGTPVVAVNQLSGTGTIQAKAGGATTHFGGLGVPVLLNLSDGTAYLAAGSPPDGVTGRIPTGVMPGPAASAAPVTGADVPSNAVLLGIVAADQTITVTVTTGAGTALGTGTLDVPAGGWWVAGLGPDAKTTPTPDPGPIDPPGDTPGEGGTPTPVPDPGTVPGVPEPATLALGLLGAAALPLRRLTRGGR